MGFKESQPDFFVWGSRPQKDKADKCLMHPVHSLSVLCFRWFGNLGPKSAQMKCTHLIGFEVNDVFLLMS
jgi:hypothetical protein